VTGSERTLLLALFRWARAEGGLQYGGLYSWARRGPGEPRWGITFHPDEWGTGNAVALEIWRSGITVKEYWVKDIAEAVDVLAALGIVPLQFSTAYRAGYDAAGRCREIAMRSSKGWTDAGVYALLPWADHELAVRR